LQKTLFGGRFQENMMEFFFQSFQKKIPKIWKDVGLRVGSGENSQ